jgi:acetate kinase
MDPTAPNGAVLLTLNIGSSSVKFAVFSVVDPSLRLLGGHFEDRDSQLRWTVVGSNAQPVSHCQMTVALRDGDTWRESILRTIFDLFRSNDMIVRAIVHRVVHGGGRFVGPTLIDGPTIEQLESYISWAPLHQPECLRAIRLTKQWYPDLPQIACFDTAFHHTIPAEAAQFAIPRWLSDRGIRRYGFHGLSFQSVWRKLAEVESRLAMGRIVVAHLGGGSSLCGIAAGRSVATTMGLTPLDGIPMATRCGAIDPGVILHLLDVEKMSVEQISRLLYRESGMLGVSKISGDMRELLANPAVSAQEAVRLFVCRVAREIGAISVDLQGIDGLVFTGGIGENSHEIRRLVCQGLEWTGIAIDPDANGRNDLRISAQGSRVAVWCLPSDEESELARQAHDLLQAGSV